MWRADHERKTFRGEILDPQVSDRSASATNGAGTYTQSHIDYVIEVCEHVALNAGELTGYRIVDEPPALCHFTATFEPLG